MSDRILVPIAYCGYESVEGLVVLIHLALLIRQPGGVPSPCLDDPGLALGFSHPVLGLSPREIFLCGRQTLAVAPFGAEHSAKSGRRCGLKVGPAWRSLLRAK